MGFRYTMDLEDGLFSWSTETIIRSQNTYSLRLLLSNNICGIKTARTQNITVATVPVFLHHS